MRRAQSKKFVDIAVFILSSQYQSISVNISQHYELSIRPGELYRIYSGVKMFKCSDFMFAEIISVYLT